MLQTRGLEGRCLCSSAILESWVWQRGTGISFSVSHNSTSPGVSAISICFSQPGVRANQPGSCSVMLGAFRQCHCGFGRTHSQIPKHVGLAASMPETLLLTSQHLALSAAPWDIGLRNTLNPSVSSQTLFAYKMSHLYPAPTSRECGHPGVGEEYSTAPALPLSGSRIQASRSVSPSLPSLSPKISCSEDPQVTQDRMAKCPWLSTGESSMPLILPQDQLCQDRQPRLALSPCRLSHFGL